MLPEINWTANAKTTRKTLERLASFSHLTCAEASPLLNKTVKKINRLVQLVDTSMIAAHLGYRLATSAMIFCDPEEQEWEADVSLETLRELVTQGSTMSNEVLVGFRDIQQEIYKIAASTKESDLVVVVPPDPTHAEERKMQLKDVGTGLVANLSLLSDFSRISREAVEWWSALEEKLKASPLSLLPQAPPTETEAQTPEETERFAKWSKMKDSFQDYYNIVNVVHVSFPELSGPSIAAWKAVATAQSLPSSEENSLIDPTEISQANEGSSKKGHDKGKAKAFAHYFSAKLGAHQSKSKDRAKQKKDKSQEVGNSSSHSLPSSSGVSTTGNRSENPTATAAAIEPSHLHNVQEPSTEPEPTKKRSWFSSCLSSSLFEDLGCRGNPEKP